MNGTGLRDQQTRPRRSSARVEIRDLRYVEAAARHRSFTRAAEELYVSQSALSHAIRSLEDDLGLPVFVRTSRHVALTPAGEAYLFHARRVLAEIDGLAGEMAEYAGAVLGRVRVGASVRANPYLPDLIRWFVRDHPQVEFSVIDKPSSEMLDGLRSGALDTAHPIVLPDSDLTGLEYRALRHEQIAIVVSRTDPMAALDSAALNAILSRRFITTGVGTAPREWHDALLARAGLDVPAAFETQLGSMAALASTGLGATILPPSTLDPRFDVAVIPVRNAPPFEIGLAWSAESIRGPAAERFLDFVLERLAEGEPR